MNKVLAAFSVVFIAVQLSLCHAASLQNKPKWERFTPNDEEFSALMPEQPAFSTFMRPDWKKKPNEGRSYAAYGDGVGCVVLSLDNPNRKESLDTFIEEFQQYPVFHSGLVLEKDVTLGGFKGKQYRAQAEGATGVVQFFLTKNHVYIFEVIGRDEGSPSIKRFLASLSLGGKVSQSDAASLSQNTEAADTASGDANENKIFPGRDVTRKAVIISNPAPGYTSEARERAVSGTVVIRCVFSKTGEVTNLLVKSGLPYGLTEKALEAARQIKFLPAEKEGRPVSMYIQLEYNFNLY